MKRKRNDETARERKDRSVVNTLIRSELEEILKELEQSGRITSYVDVDGKRYYILTERIQ
jgi:hypothetical protein